MTTDTALDWIEKRLAKEGYTYENDEDLKDIVENKIDPYDPNDNKTWGMSGFINGSMVKDPEKYKEKYHKPRRWDGIFNENKGQERIDKWMDKADRENSTLKVNIGAKINNAKDDEDLNIISKSLDKDFDNYRKSTLDDLRGMINTKSESLSQVKEKEVDRRVTDIRIKLANIKTFEDNEKMYDVISEMDLPLTAKNELVVSLNENSARFDSAYERVEKDIMNKIDRATSIESLDSIDPGVAITFDQEAQFKEAIAIQRNRLRQQ